MHEHASVTHGCMRQSSPEPPSARALLHPSLQLFGRYKHGTGGSTKFHDGSYQRWGCAL